MHIPKYSHACLSYTHAWTSSNKPPQVHGILRNYTLSLSQKCVNITVGRGFVKASTIWACAGTCWICSWFATTFSRTKWVSILMCLVHAWRIGLCASRIALMLSHGNVGTKWPILSSKKSELSHNSSMMVWSKARYSTFALNPATNTYFLELHAIIFRPRNIQDPKVEHQYQDPRPNQSRYMHEERILKGV